MEIPPSLFMCKPHWFRLPRNLRARIWAAYVPGQEIRKDPTPRYVAAATAAHNWIRDNVLQAPEKPPKLPREAPADGPAAPSPNTTLAERDSLRGA